ncbi:DUF4350 domain-containing protein [Kitasatospora sp. NBC_01287]|uniref:DUF4350 domain-containing protein n=1 Tax=Kitasatospora sp. NBC_01287 TaxID=2903573 RepID=UPI0022579A91|nr:DUF4350 domain-containing protein [Kitasatospora sp. NBC_01287]MCX4748706.1 DUF4350 domain-containing protein [Kitasatospora sp. NBC_01287]
MSTHDTLPQPAAPADSTAPGTAGPPAPTPRELWRRARWFVAGAAALLVTGLLIAGLGNNTAYPSLDPRSADPDGTKAIAQLLRAQGVTVDTTADPGRLADAADAADAGADTVLLPLPDLLTTDQLRAVAAAGHRRLVLISPDSTALDLLAPGLHTAGSGDLPLTVSSAVTAPDCPLPEAQRAGSADLGGRLYQVDPGAGADANAVGCYPRDGYPALGRTTTGQGTEVIVVGSGRFLTNQSLASGGNAALALGLLGAQPHLTWFLPDFQAQATATGPQKSFTDLIPDGWHWAALQLAVATALAALWRARRLGPVVSERLPVVVRATETTEGRARLYQRAKARGRAAEALRRAARQRLAPALGVPLTAGEPDTGALLAALGDRLGTERPATTGPAGEAATRAATGPWDDSRRPPGELHGLLYGPPPTDDAALLRLADDLDALERQVRQP